MLEAVLPERTLTEQLSGTVTIRLGGRPYRLPVLPRRAAREWSAEYEAKLGHVVAGLDSSASIAAILAAFAEAEDAPYELVRSFDTKGVIPPDDELGADTDAEWLQALWAVYRAVHPLQELAVTLAAVAAAGSPGTEPTNGRPQPTAGARRTSKKS